MSGKFTHLHLHVCGAYDKQFAVRMDRRDRRDRHNERKHLRYGDQNGLEGAMEPALSGAATRERK